MQRADVSARLRRREPVERVDLPTRQRSQCVLLVTQMGAVKRGVAARGPLERVSATGSAALVARKVGVQPAQQRRAVPVLGLVLAQQRLESRLDLTQGLEKTVLFRMVIPGQIDLKVMKHRP